ncbi:MAG: nuclear transport factor 2 family protein, partial [Acidobacteria bacterium]|nr:nuclear transport factor 2 family protein [Acidobacteriota bacterium]
MKNQIVLLAAVFCVFAIPAFSQNSGQNMKNNDVINTEKKSADANPEDVRSIDAILKATYAAISGDVGKARDWDRFNSLFLPNARLIPTGKNMQTGVISARTMSPQDYIDGSGKFLMDSGFTEKEIARTVNIFGNIAQVFSTYEGVFMQNGKQAKIRGINSFQLMHDGKRWWVVTIFWTAERP